MTIVQLITDNREPFREYHKTSPWFGTAPEALLQGFASSPELSVHVVSCTQQPMQSPEKLADNIWFHSLHVPKIGWMRTGYQGCIRAARRMIHKLRPDIVHGQGTERDCSISAVFSGFANLLTIHGNMRLISRVNHARPFTYEWLAARLERFTIPRSQGVVCITHYTQEAVKKLARRSWVIPNAVDKFFFEVVPARSTVPIILCVGVIIPRKNQNELIKSLDPLVRDRHAFKLRFLGSAPQTEYAAEFFNLLSTRSWCEHVGFVDRTTLKDEMSAASALILPSLEDNCPMTVLEAMAAGLPVVAANVGGVPDLIQDAETGLLCEPLQRETIRTAIERLLTDTDLGFALAERAKESALRRFHPDVIARKHVEIYREVLSTRS